MAKEQNIPFANKAIAQWSLEGSSVAEWLACWTHSHKTRVHIAATTLSGKSIRQTVHTHVPLSPSGISGGSPVKDCGSNHGSGGK